MSKQIPAVLAVSALAIAALIGCSRSAQESLERGNKLFQAGKYAEAELEYTAAEKKSPGLAEASYRKGLVYLKQEKFAEAFLAFDHAVSLDAAHKAAREELSRLCLQTYWTDPRKPAFLYQKLTALSDAGLKQNPTDFTSLRVKGYLAAGDQKLPAAADWFAKAQQANPSDQDVAAMLTQVKLRMGDEAGAIHSAEQYLEANKAGALVYDVLYSHFLSVKNLPSAEQILKRKVANLPDDAAARFQLAAFYRAQKQDAASEGVVAEVLNDSKRFPRGAYLAGDFYQRMGDPARAIDMFKRAIAATPAEADAGWQRIFALELSRGNRQEAAQSLESARKANPSNLLLPAQDAMLGIDDQKPETLSAAKSALEAAVAGQKSNAMLHYQLGYVCRMSGDLTKARTELREAIRLRPDMVEAHLLLSNIGIQDGNANDALVSAERAVSFAPNDPATLLAKAAALGASRRYPEARALLGEVRKLGIRADAVDREQAFLLLREGKPAEAERLFQQVYRTIPDVRTAAGYADSLVMQQKFDPAIAIFEAELRKRPDVSMMIYGLAEALARKGDLHRASRQYERWSELNPSESVGYRRQAELALQQGNLEAGLSLARRAVSLQPQDADSLVTQGMAYRLSGQNQQAEESYRAALKSDPANARAANNLAYLLATTGKGLEEAVMLSRKATEAMPAEPSFQDTLGFLYIKKGQGSEAAAVLKPLAARQPSNATYQLHYAQALILSGDKAQAKTVLTRASALPAPDPIRNEIQKALKGI